MDDGPSRSIRGGAVRPHQLMYEHSMHEHSKHDRTQSGTPDPGGDR